MFPFLNHNQNEENEDYRFNLFNMFRIMSPVREEPFNYRERSIHDIVLGRMMQVAMMELIEEQLDNYIENAVMRMSLEESKEIERTESLISFTSQRHDTLLEKQREITECSICLIDFEKSDMVSITKCNHVFHNKCIEEWSHYKHDCPVCRDDLEGNLKDKS